MLDCRSTDSSRSNAFYEGLFSLTAFEDSPKLYQNKAMDGVVSVAMIPFPYPAETHSNDKLNFSFKEFGPEMVFCQDEDCYRVLWACYGPTRVRSVSYICIP